MLRPTVAKVINAIGAAGLQGDYAKNNFTYLWAAKHLADEQRGERRRSYAQNFATKPRHGRTAMWNE